MRELNIKRVINNLTEPGETLSQRAVRGGVWVFSLRIVQQLFNLGRLVILVRILAPHDFGLLGIALLTMATFRNILSDGLSTSINSKETRYKILS